MRRFTDHVIGVTVNEDLRNLPVYVTISQGNVTVTKSSGDDKVIISDYDGGKTTLYALVDQRDTSRFKPNKLAKIQVNWIEDEQRHASNISDIMVTENLFQKVIPNV